MLRGGGIASKREDLPAGNRPAQREPGNQHGEQSQPCRRRNPQRGRLKRRTEAVRDIVDVHFANQKQGQAAVHAHHAQRHDNGMHAAEERESRIQGAPRRPDGQRRRHGHEWRPFILHEIACGGCR